MKNQQIFTIAQRKQAITSVFLGVVIIWLVGLGLGQVAYNDMFAIFKNMVSILGINHGSVFQPTVDPMFLQNPIAPTPNDQATIAFMRFGDTLVSLALIFVGVLAPITIVYHCVKIRQANKLAQS